MPDASKAKARRRAKLAEETETLKKLATTIDEVAEKAVNQALSVVPKGYRKVAHNDDMYARVAVTAYYNSSDQTYYLLISDWISATNRSVGPLRKRNLQIMIDVLKDVTQPGPHHYLE